jgi:hypothetical protein
MPVSRCLAHRRDGRECGALASSPTATYCRRHEQLAAELGDDAVQTGSYPRRRRPREEMLLVVDETPAAQPVRTIDTAFTPSEVRLRLAQVTAESVAEIQHALLDAALGATREHWVTFTCPDCGKKHRSQVALPDTRARVGASEVLLREGLGKPAQAEEIARPSLPANSNAVARMSWDDTQHLAALLFADEIESVLAQGGREAVRERRVGFSDAQREVLRDALAELAHA